MDVKIGKMEFAFNAQLVIILTKKDFVVKSNPNAEPLMFKSEYAKDAIKDIILRMEFVLLLILLIQMIKDTEP